MASLYMYDIPISKIPCKEIHLNRASEEYLQRLNWNEPWGAGSHFSHLLFFLNAGYKENYITEKEYNI